MSKNCVIPESPLPGVETPACGYPPPPTPPTMVLWPEWIQMLQSPDRDVHNRGFNLINNCVTGSQQAAVAATHVACTMQLVFFQDDQPLARQLGYGDSWGPSPTMVTRLPSLPAVPEETGKPSGCGGYSISHETYVQVVGRAFWHYDSSCPVKYEGKCKSKSDEGFYDCHKFYESCYNSGGKPIVEEVTINQLQLMDYDIWSSLEVTTVEVLLVS